MPRKQQGMQLLITQFDAVEQTFICPDGGRLRYFTAGTGEPVVLLHGLGLDASMWDAQWPVLQREFRAIRYDFRGFGGSTLPTGTYSHSDDLLALLDFLEARPAHVIGLSMGGRHALRFALDQPAAVRSLTLIDPALEGHAWSDAWNQKMDAIVAAAKNGQIDGAKRLWLSHELFAPAQRDPRLAADLAAMVDVYSAWHWRNADPVQRPASPAISELASLKCPTMVILGELDLPDFEAIAQRLAAEIPSAALRVIPGAGHMANMESPAAVNELVLTHLRAHASASARR
jgi:2-succinyl-6-hydroxy-2,4-cyclohexadiene-1-carboxylate synthase